MLRCAASLVAATYVNSTPRSSGLARLACGIFTRLFMIVIKLFTSSLILTRKE